jgi:hypothetical protein
VLGGRLGVDNPHVLVVVLITHKIVPLSITWVFDPAMIMRVCEGEVMHMLLPDLEKLNDEELNDSTEIVLDCRWWEGLDILPHLAINQ